MGKEKTKKDKEKSKSKKEKKDKKHKKHRRRSSSDSSDSDGSVEGAEQRLARERAAVNKLRDILSTFPAVRKDLREMLWRVDQGEAANISGVPDPDLKASLAQLLELLRLRRNDKGIYGLINRSEKILPVVGFVFDEPPRPRPPTAAAPPPAVASAPEPAPAAGHGGPGSASPGATKAEPQEPQGRRVGPVGPVRPEPGPGGADDDTARRPAAAEVPPEGAAAAAAAGVKEEGEEEARDGEGAAGPAAPRRVAGPAMPPRELLEAAAAAAEALRAAGPPGRVGLSYGDSDGEDDDDGLLVGPPPPELVEELDAAPQDDREAEVVRIIKVLREHNAATAPGGGGAGPKVAGGPETAADSYSVLGLDPSASAGDIKKRYMRLSLLIHPDKCSHPLAHEAFQAVAGSAKLLQDSGLRSALDERRADAELRRKAEAAAAQMERERAWRVARGEEVPVSMAGPVGPSGPQRETWMTELPPEMSAQPGAGGVSQVSVRAFSQRGKTGRGDTTAWTDTPEQRKAREAQALLAAASQAYVHALPAAGGAGAGPGGAGGGASAAALDSFNAGSRKKSLMEVHLELQEKAKDESRAVKKAAKKQKTGDSAKGGGGGGGGAAQEAAEGGSDWPWRPFDRERDLEIRPRAKSGGDILKNAAALGSKFSGGNTQRHFL